MRLLIVFTALIAAANASEWRIVGGNIAPEDNFLYQSYFTGLFDKNICGGSILNSQYILTSASCVFNYDRQKFSVVVGTKRLSSGGDIYNISSIRVHEGWNPITRENNIALVQVDRPITMKPGLVKPIRLGKVDIGDGVTLVLSGWGRLNYTSGIPDRLRYIKLRSITNTECARRLFPNKLGNKVLCTYNRTGRGACNGDDGGPLVYNGTVVGVLNWGKSCAIGYPDVFVRVSSYTDWIINTMQKP